MKKVDKETSHLINVKVVDSGQFEVKVYLYVLKSHFDWHVEILQSLHSLSIKLLLNRLILSLLHFAEDLVFLVCLEFEVYLK